MEQDVLDRRTEAVRAFNRFYTRRIGVVREGYLQSRFSLTEARVLYELANTDGLTATQIGAALDLDAGYLSRMLRSFEQDGLLTRGPSDTDKRQTILALAASGRAAFAPLNQRSRQEIGAMLARLPEPAQEAVVGSMQTIAQLLSDGAASAWTMRHLAPGDIGWVIERHGALYAAEYGFDHRFEALVAQVAGDFLKQHDPTRERAWIVHRDGVRLGSVFLVRKTDDIGKLRLLLVEPSARGLGIGKRLVEDCIEFARLAGYRRLTLWTNDILLAARNIYRAAGFRLVSSEPHSDFGPPMVGEEWQLEL
jgi:DNA-binding MarR family transcriptional regulator/N-acetylglutamate synthase-like GNAT family acetyltransferase